jgi:hypothetical protein
MFKFWHCFETEDNDGSKDYKNADNGDNTSRIGAVGMFEEKPNFLLKLILGHEINLLLNKALILPGV